MRHPQLFGAGLTYGAKKPGVNGVVSGLPIATNNMVLSISTNVPEPARVLERY